MRFENFKLTIELNQAADKMLKQVQHDERRHLT